MRIRGVLQFIDGTPHVAIHVGQDETRMAGRLSVSVAEGTKIIVERPGRGEEA